MRAELGVMRPIGDAGNAGDASLLLVHHYPAFVGIR